MMASGSTFQGPDVEFEFGVPVPGSEFEVPGFGVPDLGVAGVEIPRSLNLEPGTRHPEPGTWNRNPEP